MNRGKGQDSHFVQCLFLPQLLSGLLGYGRNPPADPQAVKTQTPSLCHPSHLPEPTALSSAKQHRCFLLLLLPVTIHTPALLDYHQDMQSKSFLLHRWRGKPPARRGVGMAQLPMAAGLFFCTEAAELVPSLLHIQNINPAPIPWAQGRAP